MTAYYPGMPARPRRLEGPDHALDALIGLVLLVAEIFIGVLAGAALIQYGLSMSNPSEGVEFGLYLAIYGGGAFVIITTIVYLVRIITARRSWPAPVWGTVLMSLSMLVGWIIMASS